MSWYKKGDEGLRKARERQAEMESKRKQTKRFWLKAGESAKICFVDDEGFYCDVHQFKVGNSWGNYATCIRDIKPCPLCDAGLNPTWTAHYTIIDMRKFEIDGKEYKNIKKLFPAKGEVIQIIADLKEKYGSLRGKVFRVKRYGAKEPNTGTHFEYIGKIKSFKQLGEDAGKPFNYEEVLRPPTPEEYKMWGFAVPVELGSDDDIVDDEIIETDDEVLEEDVDEIEPPEEDEVIGDEDDIEEDEDIIEKEPKPKRKSKPKRKAKETIEDEDEVIEDDDIPF